MYAQLLDGKAAANDLLNQIKTDLNTLQKNSQFIKNSNRPGLAAVLVGNDDASKLYINRKRQVCEEIGYYSHAIDLPANIAEKELLEVIESLNKDPLIHGVLVQLPLPSQIETQKVLEAIDPDKDVDGFHPYNFGRLAQKKPTLTPCTPAGIMHLLNYYNISLIGKHAVIIGTSTIVGRPMALELLMANCTVTLCHTHTQNLSAHTQSADILISAAGQRGLVSANDIKQGAVVVDVAMNRNEQNELCGDVDFDAALYKASWITPIPGGVGPMTIAMLMKNTWTCFHKKILDFPSHA